MRDADRPTVAVVRLGCVGLTVVAAMARSFPTIGFDIDPSRVEELRIKTDRNAEVPRRECSPQGLSLDRALPRGGRGRGFQSGLARHCGWPGIRPRMAAVL